MKTDNWIQIRHLEEDITSCIGKLKTDHGRVKASRAVVEKALKDGNTYYSINTGFLAGIPDRG